MSAVLETNEYKLQLSNTAFDPLANSFLCHAIISAKTGQFADSMEAYHHAAWVCDDHNHRDRAIECRIQASALLDKAEGAGQPISDDPDTPKLILVDLLRRSGQKYRALMVINSHGSLLISDESKSIMKFQRDLINRNDRGGYTVSDAFAAFPLSKRNEE